jgi:hypothetical protein
LSEIVKRSKEAQAAHIKDQLEAYAELTEADREVLDKAADEVREVFGESANWTVWGEQMLPWAELPEENRIHWRRVAAYVSFVLTNKEEP